MRRASQQLSYFEVYMCCLRLGCDVKIVDPLDRVTAHLHLFRHSTGPANTWCTSTRTMSKCHSRGKKTSSFVHHAGRNVQSGPFKPGFIKTSPGHVPIGSCLENGINLLIFKPHGGKGCAERLEELGISILQLSILIWGCPYVAIPSKWVQARCLCFIYMEFCRKSLY